MADHKHGNRQNTVFDNMQQEKTKGKQGKRNLADKVELTIMAIKENGSQQQYP